MKYKLALLFLTILCLISSGFSAINIGDNNNNAYYSLDNTLVDSTGVTGTLTNNGAIYTTSGKVNGAYEFDGVNDDLQITYTPSTSGWAISTWFKSDIIPVSTEDYIISQGNTGTARYRIYINAGSGTIECAIGDTAINSGYSITTGKFHFVTATWNATSNTGGCYVDGVIEKTAPATFSAPLSDLRIGSNPSSARYFDGVIDEVALWNKTLSFEDHYQLYNYGGACEYDFASCQDVSFNLKSNDPNIVVNFDFTNSSDRGFTYTEVGGATSTNVSCVTNECYELDGIDDSLNLGSALSFVPNDQDLSFSIWFRTDVNVTVSDKYIVSDYIGGTTTSQYFYMFTMQDNPSNYLFTITRDYVGTEQYDAPVTLTTENAVAPNNQWNLATKTYNVETRNVSLYLNGVMVDSYIVPSDVEFFETNRNLQIGEFGTGGSNFDGAVDDFLIMNRTLTPQEIETYYNNQGFIEMNETPAPTFVITPFNPVNTQEYTFDIENIVLDIDTSENATCVWVDESFTQTAMTSTDNQNHTANFNLGVANTSVKSFNIYYSCYSSDLNVTINSSIINFFQDQVPLDLEIFVPVDQQEFDIATNSIIFHVETNYQATCSYLVYNMTSYQDFETTNSNFHATNYSAFYPNVFIYDTSFSCEGTIVNETIVSNLTFFLVEDINQIVNGTGIQAVVPIVEDSFEVIETTTSGIADLFTSPTGIIAIIIVGFCIVCIVSVIGILLPAITSMGNGGGRK